VLLPVDKNGMRRICQRLLKQIEILQLIILRSGLPRDAYARARINRRGGAMQSGACKRRASNR